ncbi:mitochondrial export protein Som1-domain-containing protein [Scheffersomyces xylosifermentans]|uniref:mitochondrial export protein Som1-domain-containing protein n=1 Tax=Scheffersomyces xylosifermentans TaxID=1304137 RepID=UPI00315CF2FC
MAPPIPVFSRSEISSKYREQLRNPDKYKCQLKSLTQHECTFKTSPDRSSPPEIICLPFKRLFQRCMVPTTIKENGKKRVVQRFINIEVTDSQTNRDLLDDKSKYGRDVQDFLNAERDFRKLLEMESEGNL